MPQHLTDKNYNEKIIDGVTNAIIDFSATWCGPCKKLAPYYAKAEQFALDEGLDITFFEVDVDKSKKLAEKFYIRAMPTIILIKNGKEVTTLDENGEEHSDRIKGIVTDQGILEFIGRHFDLSASDCSEDGHETCNKCRKNDDNETHESNY